MASLPQTGVRDFTFWQKMLAGIALFIVLAFAQFGLRGMVDYAHAPLVMHLHAIVMVGWLGLVVSQSLLAGRGSMALHRRLGWSSAALVPLIVVLASMTSLAALARHIQPPFFTPAYFLALIHVGMAFFAAVMAGAIALRRQPEWHRRLMVGATVLLMDPALGRVLPMPFIMPWGEWLSMLVQLGVIALVWRHDRREIGHVHPATTAIVLAVMLNHALVELLARTPAWIAFATPFAG